MTSNQTGIGIMTHTKTWEEIVELVQPYSTPSAKQAFDNEEDLAVDELYVLEEDDLYTLIIGTPDGNVVLDEDAATYADGEVVTYEDDHHRDACFSDLLPNYIYDFVVQA